MNNETYELLSIDETYDVPRALILVLQNGRPSCLYQIDCYGYEFQVERCEFGCKNAGDHYHDPTPKTDKAAPPLQAEEEL